MAKKAVKVIKLEKAPKALKTKQKPGVEDEFVSKKLVSKKPLKDEEKDEVAVGEEHEIPEDALLDESYDDEEDDFFGAAELVTEDE